jgi:hypothetical protein
MHLTKKTIAFFITMLGLSRITYAQADTDCLNHLGGGLGDTLCYEELSTRLNNENQELYKKLKLRIPPTNPHARLLTDYMATQNHSIQFCQLPRDAGTKWKKSPDGTMYPAIYAGCVYTIRKAENVFLNDLWDMSQW